MLFGDSLQQFRALALKNFLLKRRQWLSLLVELAIPILLILALGQLKSVVKTKVIPEYIPSSFSMNNRIEVSLTTVDCWSQNPFWRCEAWCSNSWGVPTDYPWNVSSCQPTKIAVAPQDSSNQAAANAASEFIQWANDIYPLTLNFSSFQLFPSESSFINVIDSPSYSLDPSLPAYSSAIIFDSGYPDWSFRVRLNGSIFTPTFEQNNVPTLGSNLDLTVKSGKPSFGTQYSQTYLQSGIFTIMDLTSSFAASKACQSNLTCSQAVSDVNLHVEGVAPFPNSETTSSGFWTILGSVFGLVMIISLLYPISNVIKSLVQEKESKMREGMMMMALRGEALWASWIVHFICLFLPLSILLTLVGKALFEFSFPPIIFCYFMVFFLSSISYCIFISTLFSRSRTAAIVGTLIFFAGYFIFVGMSTSNPTRSSFMAACLHPSAAFVFATLAFAEWEDVGVGVTFDTWNSSNLYPITFQDTLNMMLVDMFYLAFLSWYLDQIWPTEFGTQKPWYFIFLPSYWFGSCFSFEANKSSNSRPFGFSPYQLIQRSTIPQGQGQEQTEVEMVEKREGVHESNIEPVPDSLRSQIDGGVCVDIRGLTKEFSLPGGERKKAVDNLDLTMFSGQITALLGHNGAGKTTTIAMLTGLLPPDQGTAIIQGQDITAQMNDIRKNLGVCPQHDILYPELTVEEHLRIFAAFKGTPSNQIEEEVTKMINSVGLVEKRTCFSKNLSGGQKRKLSVGIAFIGGSKVVFLDEPTSGMDPYSRRFTWNVIRQYREGRVIVLTTHFMDEADLLGDRIAIMGDGKLRCCGSSLFLKSRYGVGYNLTLEKASATATTQPLISVIEERANGAKLLTDVGTEISFQIPFSSSGAFQSLFNHLDSNLSSLGLQSYGVSVTTMEEVFIRVAHGTDTQKRAEAGRQIAHETPHTADQDKKAEELESGSSFRYTPVQFKRIDTSNIFQLFLRHVFSMLTKRFLYFRRDTKTWIFQYILPVIFLLAGMIIMQFTVIYAYQPPKTLSHHLYNPTISNQFLPTLYTNASYFCEWESESLNPNNQSVCQHIQQSCAPTNNQEMIMNRLDGSQHFPVQPFPAYTIYDLSKEILERKDDRRASQVGALSFSRSYVGTDPSFVEPTFKPKFGRNVSEIDFIVSSNYTAIFGSPLYAALAAEAVVETLDSSASLTYTLHPLPLTGREQTTINNYNADTVVTFLLIGIAFVPAGFAMWVVREKEIRAKQLQMVSGIGVPAYWVSNWIWDNLSFQVTIFLIVILLSIFPNTGTLAAGVGKYGGELGVTFGLLILFGAASSGFAYIISFLFQSSAGSLVSILFIHWILGFALAIVGLALRFISTTNLQYHHFIRYLFCTIPIYALGEGLHSLALIQAYSYLELKGGQLYHPMDWKAAGMPLLFLGVESVLYLLIAIAIDYLGSIPSLQSKFQSPLSIPPSDESVKDSDVKEEESRVESIPPSSSHPVLMKGLRKVYPGGKYALKGLSLAIPTGECFGLLGINGAGKSTALGILSGEIQPSQGQVFLSGLDLLSEVHRCRGMIGFCPQFDALFELLTGREHLELYARVKGIQAEDIPSVVNGKLADLGLTEYADRLAGTYSGGNKRKLSVAIAMIGEPPIVFLDEPSTGMDPVARRFMWEVISEIVTGKGVGRASEDGSAGCCLILTTHSMEEAEALCTRIGIMVGGAMRCLGSSQRLKDKYGLGYQIEARFRIPSLASVQDMIASICSALSLPPSPIDELQLTLPQAHSLLSSTGRADWIPLLSPSESGAELVACFEAQGWVSGKQLAQWVLLEQSFRGLVQSLITNLDEFVLRERQGAKVRIEVPALGYRGEKRKLGTLFGAMEGEKDALGIAEYSVCQTSLEQIFNQFAGQQEEEQGQAAGISNNKPPRVEGKPQASSGLRFMSPRMMEWETAMKEGRQVSPVHLSPLLSTPDQDSIPKIEFSSSSTSNSTNHPKEEENRSNNVICGIRCDN